MRSTPTASLCAAAPTSAAAAAAASNDHIVVSPLVRSPRPSVDAGGSAAGASAAARPPLLSRRSVLAALAQIDRKLGRRAALVQVLVLVERTLAWVAGVAWSDAVVELTTQVCAALSSRDLRLP